MTGLKMVLTAFAAWVHTAICALMTSEGRRAWAVVLCGGCGVVMTAFAEQTLWLVKDHAAYVFWLGTEAMGILLVVISAITALIAKRHIGGEVNLRDGSGKLDVDDFNTGKDGE